MYRNWISIFSIALLMFLANVDVASAKKSRSSHTAARARVKQEPRPSRAGRLSRPSQTKGKVSRRESTRHEKVARGKAARSERHSRHVASSHPSSRQGSRQGKHQRYVAETRASDSPAPRPASSGISSERATEIQKALIKAGYMDGPPSGQYDDATTQAMKQYQSANGLPQTGLPSAPLLKRLGVPKRSSDGYAVPVNTVSETEKKRPTQ